MEHLLSLIILQKGGLRNKLSPLKPMYKYEACWKIKSRI